MLRRPVAAVLADPPTCCLWRVRYPVKGRCCHTAGYPEVYKCVPRRAKNFIHRRLMKPVKNDRSPRFEKKCKLRPVYNS